MRKLFIAHHVQNDFNEWMYQNHNVNCDVLAGLIVGHVLTSGDYDKVLLHVADVASIEYSTVFDNLPQLKVEYYSWGWDIEEDDCEVTRKGNYSIYTDKYDNRYFESGGRSKYILIPEWAEEIASYDKIVYAGCFENECIDDLECLLDFIGVDCERYEIAIV